MMNRHTGMWEEDAVVDPIHIEGSCHLHFVCGRDVTTLENQFAVMTQTVGGIVWMIPEWLQQLGRTAL